MALQVRNSKGEAGCWWCNTCNSYVLPPYIKGGVHFVCKETPEWRPGESIEYGYMHAPGFKGGKWHIIKGNWGYEDRYSDVQRHTLCEIRLARHVFESPLFHFDYTEPDEGEICVFCIRILNGTRLIYPSPAVWMRPNHWYQCMYRVRTPAAIHKTCKRYWMYKGSLTDLKCHPEHTGTDFKMRHICCDQSQTRPMNR
jgi:hypothetical protein